MNIVQINCTYGKADSTGRNTMDLHRYLLSNGENSYVFTTKVHDNCFDHHVYLFSSKSDQMVHALCSRIFGRQGFFSKRSTKELLDELRKKQPDVVILHVLHSNCINLPMLFKYLGDNDIAVMLVLHDCWYYTGHCCHYIEEKCSKWKKECKNCVAIHKWNKSWFLDRAASNLQIKSEWYGHIKRMAVVGVSDWIKNEAKQSVLGKAAVIERIYNWIDTDVFKPRDKKKIRVQLGFSPNSIILLGVASKWSMQKGLREILEVAEEMEDVQVVLIGDLPEGMKVSSNVISIGTVKQPEMLAKYYAMADVFLNPSIQETFGKTTAEALSCGTPVVVYNTTACPELVDAERGAVVEFRNQNAFIDAVKTVLGRDPAYYTVNSRNYAVEHFSQDKCLSEYYRVIKQIDCIK